MLYDPVTVSNMALAELMAAPIAAMDENSLEARECSRWYAAVVGEMLEFHAWTFGRLRVVLAEVVNDRPNEWTFAYAMPDDDAFPLRLIEGATNAYSPLVGQTVGPVVYPFFPAFWWRDFVVAGSTIYSNRANASLEYTTAAAMEPSFTPLFARALSLELAVRCCMAITKSRDLKGDLIKQAEAAKQRAMAVDLNQSPTHYGRFIDEAGAARGQWGWNHEPLFWR